VPCAEVLIMEVLSQGAGPSNAIRNNQGNLSIRHRIFLEK